MKSLILVTDKSQPGSWPLDVVDQLGRTHWTDPTRKIAEVGDEWLAVDRTDAVRADYEAGELAWLENFVHDPAFFGIESNARTLLEQYILAIPCDRVAWIDNDHGWIAPVDDYKQAIHRGVVWLHASSSPLPGRPLPARAAH